MPNFGELLFALPDELKNLYRNLERVSRKLIMCNWSLKFNRTCLLENLLPKYSDFICVSNEIYDQGFDSVPRFI